MITRSPYLFVFALATILTAGCGGSAPDNPKISTDTGASPATNLVHVRRYPAFVTEYDIMTPEDEFYFHHLHNLCLGADLKSWPLVKSLVDIGHNVVDANLLAGLANETIHINDQPRAAPIIKIVNECANILGVQPPRVHIKGDSEPNAYVSGLREPHVLVLTSSLLDLYEEKPEELRFIIGHELGHLKAKHLKTHFLGRTFVDLLGGEAGAKAGFAEEFIASVAVGSLLHWYRESEYTADRAGLVCIGGDAGVAKQALIRLLHRTKSSNKLFDPTHPEFNADLVLQNQLRLRESPLVKIISYMRQSRSTHPFIAERCAAINQWSTSAEYVTLLDRTKKPADSAPTLLVKVIDVQNIPKVDTFMPFVDSGAADPLVTITYAGYNNTTSHGTDLTGAHWSDVNFGYKEAVGASLIVEVFDHNNALPRKFIGSCLMPVSSNGGGIGLRRVQTDLRLDVLENSTIVDRPLVTLEYEVLAPEAATK